MQSYFLRSAASRASRRTVSFSRSRSAVSHGRSTSGIQRPTSKQQLSQKPSTTRRRRSGKSSPVWNCVNISPCTCKCFTCVMTLLLFTGAVVMVILYFHKQKKIKVEKSDAMIVIREFMILHNESFKGKSDSDILDGVQNLAQYLSQLKSRSDKIDKATNDIIAKMIKGWKPFSGNLYYFSKAVLTFSDSKKTCVRQEAHLVDITSLAEEEYLVNEIAKETDNFFIGLSRSQSGIWTWVTGEALQTGYWGPRKPGLQGGECAIIFNCTTKPNCWNRARCEEFRRWICKLKPDPMYL